MPLTDSFDKVVTYFAAVTNKPFVHRGKRYTPRPLSISPLIFRHFICHEKCGACCPRFSLDYLPEEDRPENAFPRFVEFNKHSFLLFSDMQEDHQNHHCRNLDMENGRCQIYTHRPFSCDFEILRFFHFADGPNRISTQLFGRGWSMKRIDGDRGAKCELLDPCDEGRDEAVRKLKRLDQWARYFDLDTKAPQLIRIVESADFKDFKQVVIS